MTEPAPDALAVLDRLDALRAADAPTHGGRVLSYVYDSGRPDLDELAARAARAVQPVNGLDPTTFGSVAVMERELVGFAREAFHGGDDVVGSVTSGGTESCILAVKTARDAWRARGGEGTPRLVAPSTVHAAFRKGAHLLGLDLDIVPVDPATGAPEASAMIDRLGPDVALVVVSAPSYPFATLDPVVEVADAALTQGVDLHVDACIGGFALAFWPTEVSPWDFRVPGVTSLSADLHKYGYSPKGASVLLQRGRDRQRHQYFATTEWSGYPVVNPTLLGSKPAGPLAGAWAIVQVLGTDGGWHDVSPDPGALLINLGDLTARWTNERWMSTLHRVKPPIVAGTIERRRSAAYFHDGNADALIEAIPTTVPAGEEPLYPPITVGEHIAAKLAGSREGRRNTAGRETARVLAARGDD